MNRFLSILLAGYQSMDALVDLFFSLLNVLRALLDVVVSLFRVLLPWLPLLAWVGFWTFAVNWAKVFPILRRGGLIGVFLLMFVAVLVWGAVSPPIDGRHVMFGLSVSNYAGKFIYVTMLTCIALLSGSAQLSGAFGKLGDFSEDESDDGEHEHGHGDGHGHDQHVHSDNNHSGHGPQDHGHAAHAH